MVRLEDIKQSRLKVNIETVLTWKYTMKQYEMLIMEIQK